MIRADLPTAVPRGLRPARRARPQGPASLLIGCLVAMLGLAAPVAADDEATVPKAPPRSEGEGPFGRLLLRGVVLVDGTGAPPVGPVDVVIEGNRIAEIKSVGFPGVPIREEDRPQVRDGDRVLELDGSYLLPGFVDLHAHIGGVEQGVPAEYVFKLWMGHGITTIRDPGSGNGAEWILEEREKSRRNEITAPRIHAYFRFGLGREQPITTPEETRAWVDEIADMGADGIKLFAAAPKVLAALFDEAKKRRLGVAMHHAQIGVARSNVLDTARLGLTTMEHWYGLPEALFDDRTVQDFPPDYNYNNEQDRFGEAGRLWPQAAPPGSERWNEVMSELLDLGLTLVPTLTIYEASRDFMRVRRAEWHDEYTLPALWTFFQPNRRAHGSFFFDWTTDDELAWKENYRLWMRFLDEYKDRGGRVATGSDAGFIFKLYGFGYIRELELLREAGFLPLEVIRAATLVGAETLGVGDEVGSVEVGKLADLVVVDENPLANFKVLYGTGAIRVDETNTPRRVGGVRYTIKDGIVFDAKGLLADVRRMVAEAKAGGVEQPERESTGEGAP